MACCAASLAPVPVCQKTRAACGLPADVFNWEVIVKCLVMTLCIALNCLHMFQMTFLMAFQLLSFFYTQKIFVPHQKMKPAYWNRVLFPSAFFLSAIILIANKDSEMCADYLEHLHYRSAFSSTNLQPSFLSETLSKPPSAAAHIRNETNLLVDPKFD